MGPEQSEQQSALESTDALLNESYYYRNMTFEMKAGEGLFIYMIANLFVPQVYTIDTTLTNWVTGNTSDFIDGADISTLYLVAGRDTVFHIIFSSQDPFATGAFIYGIRKLSAEQMQYDPNASFCDRFTYIVNNWQCRLGLLPFESTVAGSVVTQNSILPGGEGRLLDDRTVYQETFYITTHEAALIKYNELTEMIRNCLQPDLWVISSGVTTDPFFGITYHETWFTLKDANNAKHLYSFRLAYDENGLNGNEVYIKFY